MFLCIAFAGEAIPFVMDDADEECLKAIEIAKMDYYFNRTTAIVETDHVYLEASPKKKHKKRLLYIHKDRIILETDNGCRDEIESTKGLLAYERNCRVEDIQCVAV